MGLCNFAGMELKFVNHSDRPLPSVKKLFLTQYKNSIEASKERIRNEKKLVKKAIRIKK
jgi:hypothetical protein